MSDREFENYLMLLAGLLRLSGKQREAIASELRSHLEDRLEELMAGGVSREEAVKQALAEFGDAAGLAGQFVEISWNRKRRWLVRLMTFSAAATLLIAASLIVFWPGRNAAPGMAAVAAQQRQTAREPDPFAPGPLAPEPARPKENHAEPFGPGEGARKNPRPSYDRIEAELVKPTSVDFVEQPLKDAMMYMAELHQIPIVLKTKKLEEAGVSPDMAVTKSLRGVQLGSALNLILEDLELRYVVRNEVLQITTPEDAESQLEIRVYDCRDLLAMPAPPGADKFLPPAAGRNLGGMFAIEDRIAQRASRAAEPGSGGGAIAGGAPATEEKERDRPLSEHDLRATRLMEIVTTNVDTDSWQKAGGPGSISEYNGLIVVTQTAETQRKVEHVFDMLREAAGLEVTKGAKVVR